MAKLQLAQSPSKDELPNSLMINIQINDKSYSAIIDNSLDINVTRKVVADKLIKQKPPFKTARNQLKKKIHFHLL